MACGTPALAVEAPSTVYITNNFLVPLLFFKSNIIILHNPIFLVPRTVPRTYIGHLVDICCMKQLVMDYLKTKGGKKKHQRGKSDFHFTPLIQVLSVLVYSLPVFQGIQV